MIFFAAAAFAPAIVSLFGILIRALRQLPSRQTNGTAGQARPNAPQRGH